MDDIGRLIRWLSKETKGTVDLRYNDNKFCVMVARGNHMWCVHQTVQDDPIESLMIAIARWKTRSPENPFIP